MTDSLWQRLVGGARRLWQRADWPQFAGADWPEHIMSLAVTAGGSRGSPPKSSLN
jgi:hypothetical protein